MPDAHPTLEKPQALRNHESKFGVDRMRRLAGLANPGAAGHRPTHE